MSEGGREGGREGGSEGGREEEGKRGRIREEELGASRNSLITKQRQHNKETAWPHYPLSPAAATLAKPNSKSSPVVSVAEGVIQGPVEKHRFGGSTITCETEGLGSGKKEGREVSYMGSS